MRHEDIAQNSGHIAEKNGHIRHKETVLMHKIQDRSKMAVSRFEGGLLI